MGTEASKSAQHHPYEHAVQSLTADEINVLKMFFADLSARSDSTLIDKTNFQKFVPLPGMLGETLYNVINQRRKGGVDLEEFIICMAVLIKGNSEERMKLLYNMYNFHGDNGISLEELIAMISSSVLAYDHNRNPIHSPSIGTPHSTSRPQSPRTLTPEPSNKAITNPGISEPLPHLNGYFSIPSTSQTHSPNHSPPLTGTNTPCNDPFFVPLDPEEARIKIEQAVHKIDEQMSHCQDPINISALVRAKHNYEQLLTKIGDDALEEYRNHCETLHETVAKMAQSALETFDYDHSGRLTFEQFKIIATQNPIILDSVFNNPAIWILSDRICRAPPCMRSSSFVNRPSSPTMEHFDFDEGHYEGYLYRQGRILKSFLKKYFVLQQGFLYEYKSQEAVIDPHVDPTDAIFLEGADIVVPDPTTAYLLSKHIEKIDEQLLGSQSDSQEAITLKSQKIEHEAELSRREKLEQREKLEHHDKFEFQIILAHRKITLYAGSERLRTMWVRALEKSSSVRHVEDYYRIHYSEHLGQGCFADVYSCEEISTGHQYAVKIVDKTKLTPNELRTLNVEISCLNLVHHPNVVFKKDVFESSTKVFMIMELLTGGTLLERISTTGKFTSERAKKVLRNLLEGIRYIHEIGIIHRDLKITNIVFVDKSNDSVAKILDFGFSAFSRPQDNFIQPVGTLKYFAPELIKGNGYNTPVDMWCLGVVLYVMLTAKFPFSGQTEQELLDNIRNVRYETREEWKAIPEGGKDLIRKLLRKEPRKRLTAKEALHHPWIVNH